LIFMAATQIKRTLKGDNPNHFDGSLQRDLSEWRPVKNWRERRLAEAALGQRNPAAVKASSRQVERFLEWVVKKEGAKGPQALLSLLNQRGGQLAQAYVDDCHAQGLTGFASIAASLRQFFVPLQQSGELEGCAFQLRTPGIQPPFHHPLVTEWEADSASCERYRYDAERYIKFVAERLGMTCSVTKELAGCERLKAARRRASDRLESSRSARPTSAIEALCREPERWTAAYAKSLCSPEMTRIGITERLTGVRAFYAWLRDQGLCQMKPQDVKNPLSSEWKLSSHPAIDLWLSAANARKPTKKGHSYTIRKFFHLIAADQKITMDWKAEELALRARLNGVNPGSSKNGQRTLIACFCKNPRKFTDAFLNRLLSGKTTPQLLVGHLSHLRRFLDWAYQVKLIDSMPQVDTPPAVKGYFAGRRDRMARSGRTAKNRPRSVWKRLPAKSKVKRFLSGPLPAEAERRIVPDLLRLEIFSEKRNQAVEALIQEGASGFGELSRLRCWQYRPERRRLGLIGAQGRIVWRLLTASTNDKIQAYLEELELCRCCARRWRQEGWNAPLFVSADGGSLVVDDLLSRAPENNRKRLEEFVALRDDCLDFMVGRTKLRLDIVSRLQGPVQTPSVGLMVIGIAPQTVLSFSNKRERDLLIRYLALRKRVAAQCGWNESVPIFPACDGAWLTGDRRP
jgi:hypothetical protein